MASTRYPPEGIRGVSVSHRGNMFYTVPDYFAQSNKNISILVQIESQTGVDNVEAIAAAEGVDGVFVGPSDLAAALGHLGNASHPEVQRAIQHIFASAKKHGKPSGILAASGSRCAPLSGMGRDLRRRWQRSGRLPFCNPETCRRV